MSPEGEPSGGGNSTAHSDRSLVNWPGDLLNAGWPAAVVGSSIGILIAIVSMDAFDRFTQTSLLLVAAAIPMSCCAYVLISLKGGCSQAETHRRKVAADLMYTSTTMLASSFLCLFAAVEATLAGWFFAWLIAFSGIAFLHIAFPRVRLPSWGASVFAWLVAIGFIIWLFGLPATLLKNAGDSGGGISIVAWNVESGGSDPAVIEQQLARLPADIYALSEVMPDAINRFANGWPHIHSESGGNDRLMICWHPLKFTLVRRFELDDINDGRHRSPLVAHLRELETGTEFLVMNNHLARGDEAVRLMQAQKLVEWAQSQRLPVLAVGDYNFDFDFVSQRGNAAFTEFTKGAVWKWIEPQAWVDTNWADRNGDGIDDYPNSMLDFAFVAGPARDWKAYSLVVVRPNDFPDDGSTSDHRPVEFKVIR